MISKSRLPPHTGIKVRKIEQCIDQYDDAPVFVDGSHYFGVEKIIESILS